MPPRFGDYMKKTSGGTNTAASSSYGSTSNQGGGPAGMTFNEAANAGIMSQQEAQQAQQAINQQASQSGQGSTTDTAAQIRARKKEEARIEEELEKSKQQQVLDLLFGSDSDPNFKKKSAFEKEGKHPLRAQLDYLIAKYGEDVVNTEQGKVLMGYLSGVPVERGGGLGARDDTYGGGEKPQVDQFGNPIDPEQFGVAEKLRQQLLSNMGMAGQDYEGQFMGSVGDQLEALKTTGSQFGFDSAFDDLRYGLSPEQYFNFNQQLMAADPTAENKAYKAARPFSSGSGLSTLLEKFAPMPLKALAGMFPERNMAGYQGFDEDPFAATFKALPQSQDRDNMAGLPMGQHPLMAMPAVVDDSNVGDIIENLLGPKKTAGTTAQTVSPFDINQFYADLPQYTYGQQGVMSPSINPNLAEYYENLRRYYG